MILNIFMSEVVSVNSLFPISRPEENSTFPSDLYYTYNLYFGLSDKDGTYKMPRHLEVV